MITAGYIRELSHQELDLLHKKKAGELAEVTEEMRFIETETDKRYIEHRRTVNEERKKKDE